MVNFVREEFSNVKPHLKNGQFDLHQRCEIGKRTTKGRLANYVLNTILDANGEIGYVTISLDEAYEKGIAVSYYIFEVCVEEKINFITVQDISYAQKYVDGILFTNLDKVVLTPSRRGWELIAKELGIEDIKQWSSDKFITFNPTA